MKPPKKKREATPKASQVSRASVDAPPAPSKAGRPKGWRPSEHDANPGGRPTEWTEERIEEMAEALVQWADQHNSLFLQSFCKEQRTYPQKLSELAAKSYKFSEALKVARNSCEANMAEATAAGEIPPAMGIFGLKQHNWKDRTEVDHSGEIKGSSVIEIHLPAKRD